MKAKNYVIIMAMFLGISFLLPKFNCITPIVLDNNSRLERDNFQPKASAGVDLTIIVTDQQLPGVQDVIDEFLVSAYGSGVNSVTVESSGTNANDQFTTLSNAMINKTTDYDVIGLDMTWLAQFVENGWIIPFDSYLETGEMDRYVSGMVDACAYKGYYYAYPYSMDLGILFYRKDLMDKNFGIGMWSESDFSTWEGLNITANAILNNETGMLTIDEADLVGYIGQFDTYESGTVNFFEISESAGVSNMISGNTVNIAGNTELEHAMTFFQGLAAPQYTSVQGTPFIIPRNGLVMDEGSSIGTWIQNNSIFMRQWTFGYESSLYSGIKFGVAPLPHFEGITGYKTSCVIGSLLAIPSFIDEANQEAAVNLTKFLGSSVAQEAELTVVSNFPALKSVYSNPPPGFEWISNWTDQIDLTFSRPAEVKYSQISNVISNEFNNILSGGKTVYNALNSMQATIEDLLKPGDFTLNSDAESPDKDGIFNLIWTSSMGADNYSVYTSLNYITEINQSLTILAEQNATSPFSISGLENGTYYYVIVAYNENGNIVSNTIKIIVDIPEKTQIISGYNEFLFVAILSLTTGLIVFKRLKMNSNKKHRL
jgi:ABC-type glycerol-3-phosphate transport system substrate-binding protein